MRLLAFIIVILIVVSTTSYAQTPTEPQIWTFETDRTGVTAVGFIPYVGKWQIRVTEKAPSGDHVLAQLMENSGSSYNIVLIDESIFQKVDFSVKMRSVAGRIDQGGGPVWRAKDENNYYIARYNPLEQNFRVYKVVEGKRRQLESAHIKRVSGWHEVRVTMEGTHIMC